MTISFNEVPATSRVPFFYAEFDASRADAAEASFSSLLIGQKLAGGSATADALVKIGDAAKAAALFGRGSMLEHMVQAFRRHDASGELWCIPVDDAGGTKATFEVQVTAAATAAGTISLYIAGRRVPVAVASGDTVKAISDNIAAAVTANADLPVTAAADGTDKVTLTARHDGTASEIDVRVNHHPDEALPGGVTLSIKDGTAGATDPAITDALTAASVRKFDVIALPSYPKATVTALVEELADRWSADEQIDGMTFMAYRGADGTVAQGSTYGNTLNSPHLSVMDAGKFPNPGFEIAASVAGAVARSAAIDPARPFQTLALKGLLAPKVGDRRAFADRNALLGDGISTTYVDSGGGLRVERLITTYQENDAGVADTAYLNVNTPLTLSYIRSDFRSHILARYARHKLADDGTRIGPGQAVITPKVGRAEAVAKFREWEAAGLVENAAQFKEDLVVERNAGNRDRMDWLLRPDLVNQFRIGGAKIAFIL